LQVIDTTGRHRAIDWITGTDGELDGMVTDISVFGAAEVFGKRAGGKLGHLLLGAGHDGLGLFGTGNDRNRRNRLEARALCRSLADIIAQAQVRQTKLPLAQSLVAGTEFALVGNCSMTTSGLGIAPQDALGLIQVAQSPAEIEQLQQWVSRAPSS
jgi:hypothetical protein